MSVQWGDPKLKPSGGRGSPCTGRFGGLDLYLQKDVGADGSVFTYGEFGVEDNAWRDCTCADNGSTESADTKCCLSTVKVERTSFDGVSPRDLAVLLGVAEPSYAVYSATQDGFKGQRLDNHKPSGHSQVTFKAVGVSVECTPESLVYSEGDAESNFYETWDCGLYATRSYPSPPVNADGILGTFELHGGIEASIDLHALFQTDTATQYARAGFSPSTALRAGASAAADMRGSGNCRLSCSSNCRQAPLSGIQRGLKMRAHLRRTLDDQHARAASNVSAPLLRCAADAVAGPSHSSSTAAAAAVAAAAAAATPPDACKCGTNLISYVEVQVHGRARGAHQQQFQPLWRASVCLTLTHCSRVSACRMQRQRVGRAALRTREQSWDGRCCTSNERLPEYNALYDVNMRHFFENTSTQSHLLKTGQIDVNGRVVNLGRARGKLHIIEAEFKQAELCEVWREREEADVRAKVQLQRPTLSLTPLLNNQLQQVTSTRVLLPQAARLAALEQARREELVLRTKRDRSVRAEVLRAARAACGLEAAAAAAATARETSSRCGSSRCGSSRGGSSGSALGASRS
ncbi:hypothetical protein JKP88DRAFT_320403 [Tribonema minus]|uniref:Uncharacterized protein n=1 Tax=Tribonema minus TaxID=303371 RepID=A0A835YVA2_9STRA|nr:hypothetical protein JKP88DRAFT_320403 [Tribonema minus]